jgi:CTP synthase (UTP-ammonia lyase)
LAYKIYGKNVVYERHRHRYEVNPEYIKQIQDTGMRFTGVDELRVRMEVTKFTKFC